MSRASHIVELRARPTLTPVELDRGETLAFALRGGRTVRIRLLDTFAAPLLTNMDARETRHRPRVGGKTIYHFGARVEVDGHPLTLERYVGAQEGFCVPWVVDGLTIWLDAVKDIFTFLREAHGPCRPAKAARFAVQDATLPICPEEIGPWFPFPHDTLLVEECYGGDDPWLGAYAGEDAHGGLDVDMPEGTPLLAPISLDSQRLVHAVARGEGNNRWEGVRRWPDGSTWTLGVSHVARLVSRESAPLKRGALIGPGAGMAVGYIEHSHFTFRVDDGTGTHRLDPWLLFHAAFEARRSRRGDLLPGFRPPAPARTGRPVRFRAAGSARGRRFAWTLGDGGAAPGPSAAHVFTRPGLYPVTLTVEDGGTLATRTCHLTVDGPNIRRPSLAMSALDEVSFRPRPPGVADVYADPPASLPHTVGFTAMSDGAIELHPFLHARERRSGPNPWVALPKRVLLRNVGGGRLGRPRPPRVRYETGSGWLLAELSAAGVVLAVNPRGLPGGSYSAVVEVTVPGALNSPQSFRVRLDVSARSPFWHATVDDRDPGCWATPYFWIAPRFPSWWSRAGHGGRALYNGRRARGGEFVRFTPFLWGGRYDVVLGPDTPADRDTRFTVRVRHARGTTDVRMSPSRSRMVGTFEFRHGDGGWVEVLADGSRGQVAADAVFFIRVGDSPSRSWDHGLRSTPSTPPRGWRKGRSRARSRA